MQANPWIRPIMAAVIATAGASASAQTVYRCGNLYSDSPCAGALAIDASDSRTPEQKAQTDAAARQSAQLADRLERERQALEGTRRPMPAANRTGTAGSVPRATASKPASAKPPAAASRKAQAEPFTAAVVAQPGARTSNEPGRKPATRTDPP